MADCSYARCMQERRTIKKQLQKWTKNCIYTLGFERVAEEFMGRRKWRLYQERVLKSWCPSIEREIEVKDWDPSEDKCSFCDLEPSGKVTDYEPASPLRSECYSSSGHNNNNHIDLLEGDESDSDSLSSAEDSIPTMNALDSVTSMAAIAALAGPGGAPNPLLYPPGVFPRWYLPQPPRGLMEGIVKSEPPMVMNLPATAGSEMPLDLSAKSSKPPPPTESPDNIRVPNMMDNKPMFKAKPRMNPMTGRRAYTEDELQAALRDIQSGKLGTRRAAVIYGIPRSTLRNKVYKLALERERDAHLLPLPRPSPPDGAASSPSLPVNAEREDSSAEDEKESEMLKPQLSMEDLMRLSAMDSSSQTEGLTNLLHSLSKLHAEGSTNEMLASESTFFKSYLAQLLKLKENVSPDNGKEKEKDKEKDKDRDKEKDNDKEIKKEDAEKSKDGEEASKETEDATSLDSSNDKAKYSPHILPELMKRIMAEERLLIEEQLKRKMASENGVDDDQSNVILKIPSFKPNASCSKSNNGDGEQRYSASPAGASQENSRHSVMSPSLNGDSESPPVGKNAGISSLRDVIAKSISQKFQQDGLGHGLSSAVLAPETMDALAKRGGFSHLNLPHPHSILKNHFDRNQQRPQHSSSAQSNSQGKGTRPKRGKYRNYDRDSLVEAVRAVQRGEMSVHRAGSYYGVPHSTLEYKVKERHLMRPRKREPKGEDKNKLTPPTGSSSANVGATEKPKQLPLAPKPTGTKPTFPNPAALPNGIKLSPSIFETGVSPLAAAYAGGPFPFWPPSPFHHLPIDISRGTFPPTPEQLFAPQLMRAGGDAAPNPALPPSARRIAESLYDGTGNNGSFLDGIIRSSLEMGLASQKAEKDSEKSGKNTENMSNKALLDQLCRNSRLTPVPRPSGESNSDDDVTPRNVPYDLSRSSDDDNDDKRSKKSYGSRHSFSDRKSSERELKRGSEKDINEDSLRVKGGNDEKNTHENIRNFQENRSYRSSMSDENDRSKHSSDEDINGDQDAPSPDDLQNLDDDIDNISNHASDDEDVKDS